MALQWFIEITKLIAILVPLIVFFVRMNRNHKDIKKTLKESDSERLFEKSLLRAIQKESTEFIDNTNIEGDGIISLLIQWKNNFHKLALDSYRSGYRGDKRKTEMYLSNEIDSLLINIRLYSQNFFHINRVFKGQELNFFDFVIYDTELNVITRSLKRDLVNNGLDNEAYVELFSTFISESFKEIYKGKKRWSRLSKSKQ